ncbi:MAG: hypothetical protein [Agile wallaby adenovirus 1]|nr:MAG: hypothetical protein [Agile wallaby atadenovirus 1]
MLCFVFQKKLKFSCRRSPEIFLWKKALEEHLKKCKNNKCVIMGNGCPPIWLGRENKKKHEIKILLKHVCKCVGSEHILKNEVRLHCRCKERFTDKCFVKNLDYICLGFNNVISRRVKEKENKCIFVGTWNDVI